MYWLPSLLKKVVECGPSPIAWRQPPRLGCASAATSGPGSGSPARPGGGVRGPRQGERDEQGSDHERSLGAVSHALEAIPSLGVIEWGPRGTGRRILPLG